MRLNRLLNISEEELQARDILNIDFSSDVPFFIDFEKYYNSRYNTSDNLTMQFISNLVVRIPNLNKKLEVEGFGLGFAIGPGEGRGPQRDHVQQIYDFIHENQEYAKDIRYMIPLLDGLGPDGFSDLMLLGFEHELKNISTILIDGLIKEGVISDENVTGFGRNKQVKFGDITRSLIPVSIVSSLNPIVKVLGKISSDKSEYGPTSTNMSFREQLVEILSSGISIENIKLSKVVSLIQDSNMHGTMGIASTIIGRIRSVDGSLTTLELIELSARIVIEIKGNKDLKTILEDDFHSLMKASYMTNGNVPFIESELGGGRVEFAWKDNDVTTVVEVKRGSITENNLDQWKEQLLQYCNSVTLETHNKRPVLLIYTDDSSIVELQRLMEESGKYNDIKVIAMTNLVTPSSGVANKQTQYIFN